MNTIDLHNEVVARAKENYERDLKKVHFYCEKKHNATILAEQLFTIVAIGWPALHFTWNLKPDYLGIPCLVVSVTAICIATILSIATAVDRKCTNIPLYSNKKWRHNWFRGWFGPFSKRMYDQAKLRAIEQDNLPVVFQEPNLAIPEQAESTLYILKSVLQKQQGRLESSINTRRCELENSLSFLDSLLYKMKYQTAGVTDRRKIDFVTNLRDKINSQCEELSAERLRMSTEVGKYIKEVDGQLETFNIDKQLEQLAIAYDLSEETEQFIVDIKVQIEGIIARAQSSFMELEASKEAALLQNNTKFELAQLGLGA